MDAEQEAVAGWLEQIGQEEQTDKNRRGTNSYGRRLRYIVEAGTDSVDEFEGPLCTKDIQQHGEDGPSTSKGVCPRKDVLADYTTTTEMEGIFDVLKQVATGEISTAAEFIFCISPYVKDRGAVFHEVLVKDLNLFREMVDDTMDRRAQDEGDVMMHTQNDIKRKFKSLTEAMIQRTMRIRQRLFEISPKFDWTIDGKDKAKIAKLITVKRKEMSGDPRVIDKLTHQAFMRGQWIKKELTRLQEENMNLKMYLDKFRLLAAERNAQKSSVSRMLCKEKKALGKELNRLRKAYRQNMEIIDALYVEHHRCIKPPNDTPRASVSK